MSLKKTDNLMNLKVVFEHDGNKIYNLKQYLTENITSTGLSGDWTAIALRGYKIFISIADTYNAYRTIYPQRMIPSLLSIATWFIGFLNIL